MKVVLSRHLISELEKTEKSCLPFEERVWELC